MKESEYDRIMRQGEDEYLQLKKEGDPYAFQMVNRLPESGAVGVRPEIAEMKERLLGVIERVKYDLTAHNIQDPMAQHRVRLAFTTIKSIIKQY